MSDTPALPKFYILTIPGTLRHVEAERQLASMGVEYEFVYGRIWPEDSIPWQDVRDINRKVLHTRYPQRCYGCREGHIRLLEKALNDRCSSILSCEDDVWFEKMDLSRIAECHSNLQELGGIVNLGNSNVLSMAYWRISDTPDAYGTVRPMAWCTDSCYLLDKHGMEFYLRGLKAGRCESDVSMTEYCKKCKRRIPTFTNTASPVTLNPALYASSTIQI